MCRALYICLDMKVLCVSSFIMCVHVCICAGTARLSVCACVCVILSRMQGAGEFERVHQWAECPVCVSGSQKAGAAWAGGAECLRV